MSGVGFSYPDGTAALFDIDLTVDHGERVAVLGGNGAGKTTLLLLLNGIHLASQGSVHVAGVRVAANTLHAVRSRVGVVFQDPDDQLFMPTVRQDVAFGPQNQGYTGLGLESRVDAAMAAMGITGLAGRAPDHLGLGEKRRVALAGVLAMEPNLLVLDDPTGGLDPPGRKRLIDLQNTLGATQVVATPDLDYAAATCHRAVVLHRGRLVADGPSAEILADPIIFTGEGPNTAPGGIAD
ncbi:MAG: ABC transporter ATP-binding protein [Actinobacteria bacterium]|nr:ABC transporter ATP-binding protein [Actinomycetota bacterium]NIS33231.1 ABC transporter ATP-binding protein [Actinomycetota bacterium]NIU20435.1 ABC transporter ATP-binding protein [Actinomycetota bacterium]NIU68145.1 ABC transporter ATP-binding protein [Actinomycetota bacterium]NIV88447.1 ATP-binding cassette domain-containing protein [Actinomycetota bacterium]